LKQHDDQLVYRIKAKTNDELRQDWMDSAVPLCAEIGIDVPAHYDDDADEYRLEYDLPVAFDEAEKRFRFDEPITWDDVIDRWRSRGPANEQYVSMLQEGTMEAVA